MKETKQFLIFGGTGFVGRAFVEKSLLSEYKTILITRSKSSDDVKEKLQKHGLSKEFIDSQISKGNLKIVLDVNLVEGIWADKDNWLKLINSKNINLEKIDEIFNFCGLTSSTKNRTILESNGETIKNILILVRLIKENNKDSVFINMGSAVEKKEKTNFIYDVSKKKVRSILEESNICDYQIITEYIKGKGEIKMTKAAPLIWSKLKYSRKWLFGFKVSIVDVDDLADSVMSILNNFKFNKVGLNEIFITSGEIVFGEMIKALLPEDKNEIPKLVIPSVLENTYLYLYFFLFLFFIEKTILKLD